VVLDPGSTLTIEVATAGFGHVTADSITYGGTLDIEANTEPFGSFHVIAANSVSGAFSEIDGLANYAGDFVLDPLFTAGGLTLAPEAALFATSDYDYQVSGQYLIGDPTHDSMLDGSLVSNDVLIGQGGNNTLIIGDTSFDFLDGGRGTNTLELSTSAATPTFDFTTKLGLVQNIAVIDPTHATDGTTIDLNVANVANMSQGANALVTGALGAGYGNSVVIFGSSATTNDTVNLTGSWALDATHSSTTIGGESYAVYTNGNAHVLVDSLYIQHVNHG